jgi:hypothetical protein
VERVVLNVLAKRMRPSRQAATASAEALESGEALVLV